MNYQEYHMSLNEKVKHLTIGASIISLVIYLFYNSIILCMLLTPLSYFYLRYQKQGLINKRRSELNHQFKDAMYAMSSALNAGYAIENAFPEIIKDLRGQYNQEDTLIIKEFIYMYHQIQSNVPVEAVLEDFGIRSDVEDIKNFAEVFKLSKRGGGDMIKIIKATSRMIGEKIEINREVSLLMAAKKYEHRVMSGMPFVIIIYLRLSSPSLLYTLYGNGLGILIMTMCLIIYGVGYGLSQKIMQIEV